MNKQQIINEFIEVYFGDKYNLQRELDNGSKTDIRCMFIDFVDYLRRDGRITDHQQRTITCPSKWY